MTDERPTLITVPTELDRQDAIIDVMVFLWSAVGTWYAVGSLGVPLFALLPLLVVAAVWMLTGEPAGDVTIIPLLGALASGMRSKLGLRRAHEWLLAWGHYTQVRTIPDLRAWWASSPSKPVVPPYPRISLA